MQKNKAVKTALASSQYLELGDLSVTCITVPESCGAQGATISVWIKVMDCQDYAGIVTTFNVAKTNFNIGCSPTVLRLVLLLVFTLFSPYFSVITVDKYCFRFAIDETNGFYLIKIPISSDWIHVVMVYHGVGMDITAYHDGTEVGSLTEKQSGNMKSSGNGNVFIGRRIGTNIGPRYASVYVDELKMYNSQLSEGEICKMY